MNLAFNILQFGRKLRAAGLDIHHGRLLDALRALEWVDVGSRTDVAATLRSLLVHDRDEIARFDRAFDLFFKAHRPPEPGLPLFSLGVTVGSSSSGFLDGAITPSTRSLLETSNSGL